ncbi:MAG: thioredoxin family protein [Planctomycetota bacterium]
MGPQVEALVNQRPDLRLLRIDIKTWRSPVARQFGIDRLPTVWLYQDGQRLSGDTRQALDLASRPPSE